MILDGELARFGARSSASILFLGSAKLLLAVFFGGSLLTLLHISPKSILGVLLSISGLELALVATDQRERVAATIMLGTAAGVLALGSTATGFVIGWILALLIGWKKKDNSNNGYEHQG